MALTLTVNGQTRTVDLEPDTPLLWAIRETLGLTGTKFGCGISACGACTVHLNGRAVRSCTMPVSTVPKGRRSPRSKVSPPADALTAVQQAWVDPSGAAVRLLPVRDDHGCHGAARRERPNPTDDEIDASITNICRCGTFARVRHAIHAVAEGQEREGGHRG